MKTKPLIGFLLLLTVISTSAQNNIFITSGKIEFEKTANTYAILLKQITSDNEIIYKPIYDKYVQTHAKFVRLHSTMSFSPNATLFVPQPDSAMERATSFESSLMILQNNLIFKNLATGIFQTQKKFLGKTFIVKDSLRHIKWKITGEKRDIAGFTCRRANAIILDSIYVVAFYTDQIPVSGGPESFSGLPGMILGLALPHEDVYWFATKVTPYVQGGGNFVVPKSTHEKTMSEKEFRSVILRTFKGRDSYQQTALKALLL